MTFVNPVLKRFRKTTILGWHVMFLDLGIGCKFSKPVFARNSISCLDLTDPVKISQKRIRNLSLDTVKEVI